VGDDAGSGETGQRITDPGPVDRGWVFNLWPLSRLDCALLMCIQYTIHNTHSICPGTKRSWTRTSGDVMDGGEKRTTKKDHEENKHAALPCLALRCPVSLTGRSTQLQLTATYARLYEIDHHWTTPYTRVTRLIHSTRDDAYKVHNITHDPLSRIDSIHCNRSNQERGRVTDPRNKKNDPNCIRISRR
jgi:hypothetical protein